MEPTSINRKVKQDQKAKELGCLSSLLQHYRYDMKMHSSNRSKGS